MPVESKNPPSEPSSPACSMREADDAYMGFAGKEEIETLLRELLAAERALARKLRETLPRVRDDDLHAKLGDMAGAHECHIALLDALVS
jgi:hypothetical protein